MYLFSVYPEGFKELAFAESESFEDYDHFCWNGQPRLNGWQPPKIEWFEDEFSSDSDETPDITSISGVIAVSERAHTELRDLFINQVEFLPTIGPDEQSTWYLVNITNVLPIMDSSKSKFKIKKNGKTGICEHAYINKPDSKNKIYEVKGFEPHIFIDKEVKTTIENSRLAGALIREYLNPST